MRMSTTHKIAVTAVVTTLATATVLTFTRGDTAPQDRIASLPQPGSDSPAVAGRTTGPTTTPTPTPTPRTNKPAPVATERATRAPQPAASGKPASATSEPPKPTTKSTPTPSPAPTKDLLEILLGQ